MFLIRFWNRTVFRWRRARLERELIEELEFHRSLTHARNRQAGLTPDAALALSNRQMGNVSLAQEDCREAWSFMTLERFLQDLRYAFRIFVRAPVFTAIAVLSLAIGIGGNAAMFSLVNRLLVRPLPYLEPDRLLRITGIFPRAAVPAFQQQGNAMDTAAASTPAEYNFTGMGEASRVYASAVSANLFSVLGCGVARGRAFRPGEDSPGRDAVVILSDSLWKGRFGSDSAIVGRTIVLNGQNREVIGVMAPGFSFLSAKVQVWFPMRLDPTNFLEYWAGGFVQLYARLRPGATLAQAQGEVHAIVARFRPTFPYPMARDFNADSTAVALQQDIVGDIRSRLIILLASVGIVLLIACANVASLLLSRTAARRKEIALRVALGARRMRIVRQLLTESVLLALMGGGLGILLGMSTLSIFKSVLPSGIPGLAETSIDWQIATAVGALAIVTGLAFGIAPALSTSQLDLAGSIKSGSQRSGGALFTRMRGWLIATEVALTVVLVVGAGLLIRSLYTLSETQPGFRPAGILAIRISPNQSACAQRASCIALYGRLLQRVRTLPGVTGAAVANTAPLDGMLPSLAVDVEGHPKSIDHPAPLFWLGAVSSDYTSLMHIPLLAGRELSEADGPQSAPVVLVSAGTANHFWPGQNPIGKHIKSTGESQWRTIVGVVGNVRQFQLSKDLPDFVPGAVYMPYAQAVRDDGQIPAAMTLLVRTAVAPAQVAPDLRRIAQAQNPDIPVGSVQSLEEIVAGSISDLRSTIRVFLGFAGAAIMLAAIGIYGVLSYWVVQRTYEIGVRSAMGASRPRIVWMIMTQGLRLTAYGVAAGAIAALALTRFLGSLLYGVGPADPLTFVSVIAVIFSVAAAAAALPAARAARIDPIRCLRAD